MIKQGIIVHMGRKCQKQIKEDTNKEALKVWDTYVKYIRLMAAHTNTRADIHEG